MPCKQAAILSSWEHGWCSLLGLPTMIPKQILLPLSYFHQAFCHRDEKSTWYHHGSLNHLSSLYLSVCLSVSSYCPPAVTWDCSLPGSQLFLSSTCHFHNHFWLLIQPAVWFLGKALANSRKHSGCLCSIPRELPSHCAQTPALGAHFSASTFCALESTVAKAQRPTVIFISLQSVLPCYCLCIHP